MCYLYNQTGRSFTAADGNQLDTEIDEGFGDVDGLEESPSVITTCTMDQDEHPITVAPPADPDEDEQDEAVEDADDEALNYRGIGGWEKVDRLARALVNLKGLCVTNAQAEELKMLYSQLLDYDKNL